MEMELFSNSRIDNLLIMSGMCIVLRNYFDATTLFFLL